MRLFTIGYEKRGIDDFINILRENEIEVLVDIRAVPHSRIIDFAKRNLERHLSENGIDYLLKKGLGSPKELRNKVKSDGDYDHFFAEYDNILKDLKEHITELLIIVKIKKTCLFCYEADVNRCHRRSVAKKLRQLDRTLEIINL
jgi:uncharacterized protein (DUF488 family)